MIANPMSLAGRIILVTGASSGIGREICVLNHALGAKVIPVARSSEKLFELCDELGIEHHYSCIFDLANIGEIENMISSVVTEHGRLDGIVHSAGICKLQSLNLSTPEHTHETFLINFYSFIELVRCFLKKSNNNTSVRGASVVGISSMASVKGLSGGAVYAASKGAMNSAVRSLAIEYAKKNVRFNVVSPGVIRTPIYTAYEKKIGADALLKDTLSKHPLGLGEPIDIANMVVFLLSDAGRLITGQNILVDAGGTA